MIFNGVPIKRKRGRPEMASVIRFIRELLSNPLLAKELHLAMRSSKFFLLLIAFVLASSAALVVAIKLADFSGPRFGLRIFLLLFGVQTACLAITIPAYACSAIAGERQQRTFDLLITTALRPWEIIWGKFAAIMAAVLVILIAFLPLIFVCFLYGGTDPLFVLASYLHLVLAASSATLFCLMLSCRSGKPATTILFGYLFAPLSFLPFIVSPALLRFLQVGPFRVLSKLYYLFGFGGFLVLSGFFFVIAASMLVPRRRRGMARGTVLIPILLIALVVSCCSGASPVVIAAAPAIMVALLHLAVNGRRIDS